MKILPVCSMQETDRRSAEDQNITEAALIKRAGKACYDKIFSQKLIKSRNENIAVVCSHSNNSADGFALASLLLKNGYKNTKVYFTGSEEKMKAACAEVFKETNSLSVGFVERISETDLERLGENLAKADVIIDALIGVGFKGKLREKEAKIVDLINQSPAKVISIDIPTGLNADTGAFDPVCVNADFTLVINNYKYGNVLGFGSDCCGKQLLTDIGLNQYDELEGSLLLTKDFVKSCVPERKNNSNKYDFGNVLVIGCNKGMAGSGIMSAEASLKSGCGLVSIACPENNLDIVSIKAPLEIMTTPLKNDYSNIDDLLKKKDTVVFGMGLGKDGDFEVLLGSLLMREINLIVDADGLYYLAVLKDEIKNKKANLIVTPHTKEAANLLYIKTEEVKNDPVAAAKEISSSYNCTTVLKGHNTFICASDLSSYICMNGNSGMATAGSGDVLSGIIAGVGGKRCEVKNVCLGVYLHGLAGDIAAEEYGKISMTATDITRHIHNAFENIMN